MSEYYYAIIQHFFLIYKPMNFFSITSECAIPAVLLIVINIKANITAIFLFIRSFSFVNFFVWSKHAIGSTTKQRKQKVTRPQTIENEPKNASPQMAHLLQSYYLSV